MRSRTVYALLAVVLSAALAACGASSGSANSGGRVLKVALLTSGPINDGSFNQYAYTAMQRLQSQGLVKFQVREDMADPSASTPVIHEYAASGYDLIIGHGIELSKPIFQVAKQFPKVHFLASGALSILKQATANVDTWTYDFGQQGYLMGYVGGKIAHVTKAGIVNGPKLGFVTAASNGVAAGFKASNPAAKIQAVYTGSFDNVQSAQQAASGLIAGGAQLVFTTGDGIVNGVAAAAAANHVVTIGVTGSAGGLAKKVNVTSVQLNMYPVYSSVIKAIQKGTFGHKGFESTIADGGLVLSKVNMASASVPSNLEADAQGLAHKLATGQVKLPSGI